MTIRSEARPRVPISRNPSTSEPSKMTRRSSRILPGIRCLFLCASVYWGATDSTKAVILARSDFNAGFGPGAIAGQPQIQGNPGDFGYSGPYSYSPSYDDVGNGNHLEITSATGTFSLDYNVTPSEVIRSGANAVDLVTSAAYGPTVMTRHLSQPVSGMNVFASLIVKPIVPGGASSTDLLFTFGDGWTAPFFGVYNRQASAGLYGVVSSVVAASNVTLMAGQKYLLVVEFIWNPSLGAYDKANLWLNPSVGASSTPTATAVDMQHAFSSIDRTGLFAINMTANSRYSFDSFIMATTWAEVMPVASAATIDPVGGAQIDVTNISFPGTAFKNYCGEVFTAVTQSQMAATPGMTVLDFEAAQGFGAGAVQMNPGGSVFGNTTQIAPFAAKDMLTRLNTPNGHEVKLEWRSFDRAHVVLGAPDPGRGVFLVRDRSANDTMTSGTQGLIAGSVTGPEGPGGAYLTFDRNVSQFGAVLKSNAGATQDVVALYDEDGVLIAKYDVSIPQGQALFFGIKSPSSLIRSVLIAQGGNVNGLIIDDLAFVYASPPATSLSFSFAAGSLSGWSQTSGATLFQKPDHLTIQGTNWDSKIYRAITLPPGNYVMSGVGSKSASVSLLSDWSVPPVAMLNLSQASGWRSDFKKFSSSGGTLYLQIQVHAASGEAEIQSLSIMSDTETPYDYDTYGMQVLRPSPAMARGMLTTGDQNAFNEGNAYEQMKAWKCNVVRLMLTPASYARSQNLDFETAWPAYLNIVTQNLQKAQAAGLKVVLELHEMPFVESQGDADHANWTRDDLSARFCSLWRDIVTVAIPYQSVIWAYEVYNEPHDNLQFDAPRQWWPLFENVRHTIRSIHPGGWIIYDVGPGGYFAGFAGLRPFPDQLIIYSAHFYYPMEFTHQGVYDTNINVHYPSTINGVYYDKARLESFLAPADAFAAAWHVPIYVGEFSTSRWGPVPDTANYLQDVVDLLEERHWSWAYCAWKVWSGWRLDHDNTFWQEPQPYPPDTTYTTDRGQVIKTALEQNGP
jgi:endoglucanase